MLRLYYLAKEAQNTLWEVAIKQAASEKNSGSRDMILTWYRGWPIWVVPLLGLLLIGLLPYVRQEVLNFVLLPLLGNASALLFVQWYAVLSNPQEYVVFLLMDANIYVLCLCLLLYFVGSASFALQRFLDRGNLLSLNKGR